MSSEGIEPPSDCPHLVVEIEDDGTLRCAVCGVDVELLAASDDN